MSKIYKLKLSGITFELDEAQLADLEQQIEQAKKANEPKTFAEKFIADKLGTPSKPSIPMRSDVRSYNPYELAQLMDCGSPNYGYDYPMHVMSCSGGVILSNDNGLHTYHHDEEKWIEKKEQTKRNKIVDDFKSKRRSIIKKLW